MNRRLDGVFFRVCREGKWQSLCFSDLTEDEMNTGAKGVCYWRKRGMLLGKKRYVTGEKAVCYWG